MKAANVSRRAILRGELIGVAIARVAHQIVEGLEPGDELILVGIRRGGESLTTRLAKTIGAITGREPQVGFLNINLYRDDDVAHEMPESSLRADLTGKHVVIVDDVLFTGRTIRSALDAVTDLGRPRAIRLAVLVDRGLRELPIQGDYVGRFIPTKPQERVEVKLGAAPSAEDEVVLLGSD